MKEVAVNTTRHPRGTEFDSKLLGNELQKENTWGYRILFF